MFQRLFIISITTVMLSQATILRVGAQERVVLPSEINSPYVEIRPFISGDGNTLYFSRRAHPANQNGVKDLQDIWIVKRSGGEWEKPVNPGEPINNKLVNSLCTVSPDGKELLLFNTYKEVEGPLVRMRHEGEKWSEPEEVIIENYQNQSDFLDFFQSYSQGVLLMALEREDTHGEQDLYVSFPNENGGWSKPQGLGPVINTKKSDFAPFLAADGKTLFYATYGLKGKGGADIFFSRRLDDTWTKWSKPVNVGAPINTSGDETYCSLTDDMRSMFYVSYKPGSDLRDIYESHLPEDLDELGRGGVVAQNKSSKNTKADIAVVKPSTEKVGVQLGVEQTNAVAAPATSSTSDAAGAGEPLKSKTTAAISRQNAAAAGPMSLALSHKRIESDIPDKLQYSILRNIYFEFNQISINKQSYEEMLIKILDFMQENPTAQLKFVGHADEQGTPKDNLKVSQQRAQAVKDYLVQQGIAAERLLVHFRGETEPLASNDDNREGRELNRRVELYVLMPEAAN